MKKIIIICCMVVLTFTVLPAYAQENKVVVIPLNSSKGPGDWKTVSVSAYAGMPEHYDIKVRVSYVCSQPGPYAFAGASGTKSLIVPIQLPDGATITSFSAVICDNVNTYGGSMILYRSDNEFIAVAGTSVAEMSTTPYTKSAGSITEAYKVVDNSQYSYFIHMAVSSDVGLSFYPITGIVTLE